MATLQIRKKSNKVWLHIASDQQDFIISKFYFNADGLEFQIVEQGQSKRNKYTLANISVYDIGGSAEVFSTMTALSLRLESLKYPAFYRDGESILDSFLDLTDTPSTYIGQSGKLVKVKSGEDGLEFGDPSDFNLKVYETGETPIENIDEIEFDGATVTDDGGGKITVTITGGSTPTLQEVLDNNHDLVDGNFFAGTSTGDGNTGIGVIGIGSGSAAGNQGDYVVALSDAAANGNIGTSVNAFGLISAQGNEGNSVNALGALSAFYNLGSHVNALGENSCNGNSGNNVNALGNSPGSDNTYDNVNLFGENAQADENGQTVLSKDGTIMARISTADLTDTRKYTLQDDDGTLALTSDIPPAITIDATPTDGSANAVSSNGVFDALALKADLAIQVTPITLSAASWTLVSGLYEYDYANANITSASIVDVIPSNSTIAIVQSAGILPSTISSTGSVKLYATNLPSADIVVTFNIFN